MEKSDTSHHVLPPGNAAVDENGNFVTINPLLKSQLLSYSLQPKVVPNYVLDKLSLVHYKDGLKNTNVNNNQADTAPSVKARSTDDGQLEFVSFMNDPFIKSVNNNWTNLLSAIKQADEFGPDRLTKDENFEGHPDFNVPWGGDERLRTTFLGASAADNASPFENKTGFWSRLFSRKKRLMADDDPQHRSKAGYWMLDEKRKDLIPTIQRFFVRNPLVPLFLRISILMFSACALAMAVSIYIYSRRTYDNSKIEQQPSTIFAIVVQSFAILYVVYITYDEYSGKPLGLRNPLGKMKLIMLDLLFIMCSCANMALAFGSLFDEKWVCEVDYDDASGVQYPTVAFLCRRQRALTSFLFLVLFLWVLTFTISIVRVVDRVSVGQRPE